MLKDKNIMPPLWIAYPEFERHSIGWRMGYGESYLYEWQSWLETLTEEEVKTYQELFPAPVTWNGYWEEKQEYNCYTKNEFFIQFWRENGAPKYSIEQIRKAHLKGKNLNTNFFGDTNLLQMKIFLNAVSANGGTLIFGLYLKHIAAWNNL